MISLRSMMMVLCAGAFSFTTLKVNAANRCREPLTQLVDQADEIGRRADQALNISKNGPCLDFVLHGNSTKGTKGYEKCKAALGKTMMDRYAGVLRALYDDAVHVCRKDCEDNPAAKAMDYSNCKKGLSELPIYGTKWARIYLKKIKN